jgi:hypothetical protein
MPRYRMLLRVSSPIVLSLLALGLVAPPGPAFATQNVVLGELYSADG